MRELVWQENISGGYYKMPYKCQGVSNNLTVHDGP